MCLTPSREAPAMKGCTMIANQNPHQSSQHAPFPLTRRDVLKAACGLGLSFALPGLEGRAAEKRGSERAKSFIVLWLAGGASQLETWDPHPGTSIGGPTRAIPTRIPHVSIAEHYPQLADQIDCLSVIRSLVSKEGDHERGTYFVKTGYRPDPTLVRPAVGAVLVHELPDPQVEIPQHVSLTGGQWPARGGYLGEQFDAFKIYDPGRNIHNMRPPVADERQQRRLENLDVVSSTFRQGRASAVERTLHEDTVNRALAMMTSDQLKAFDVEQEPRTRLAAYGDSRFGRGCLVARRLVEAGVRSVEVTLEGFDSHRSNFEWHAQNAAILDPAFAALLRDLKERALLESTVVLCLGEFGRTPKINPFDGRDHWPSGFSCLVGGGEIKPGVLIGATDPTGQRKEPTDPVDIADLYATVFSLFGVDCEKDVLTPIGRPVHFCDGKPLAKLLT